MRKRKRKAVYGTMIKLTEIFEAAKESNTLLTEVAQQINEQIGHDALQQLIDATEFVVSADERYFTDIRVALSDYLISFIDRLDDIEGQNWNDEDVSYGVNCYVVDDGIMAYQMTAGSTDAASVVNTLGDVLAAETWFEETWSDKPPGFRAGAFSNK